MPRIRIDGYPIGCPVVHGEGNCPFCGGGWPGTKSSSSQLYLSAEKDRLNPESLGCGTLVNQGKFLVAYFSEKRKENEDISFKIEEENDLGVGPVGGGVYGPAMVDLIAYPDLEEKRVYEKQPVNEVQVGPLVILSLNGK